MIKEREQQINNIFGVFDVILSVFAFMVAFFIRDWFFEPPITSRNEYLIIGLLIIPTWFVLIKSVHLAEIHRTKSYSMIFASYLLKSCYNRDGDHLFVGIPV
ncbi:MAG: hypothetical protein K8S16_11220 [Bacteroidales bacterium]|nr:hypothetical protein [Bacteroidales bacterium]